MSGRWRAVAWWPLQLAIWFIVALPFAPSVCAMVILAPSCSGPGAEPLRCEAFVAVGFPILFFTPKPDGPLPQDLFAVLLTAGMLSLTITSAFALLRWRRRRREALAREAAAAAFEG